MIQQDNVSFMFIVLAVSIFLYMFTIVGTAVVLFPVVMLLSGIILHNLYRSKFRKGSEEYDFDDTEITNENLWKNLIFDTVIALFGVFLVNQAINSSHSLAVSTGLSGPYQFLFEVLIGIAEEQFFRGFLTDWILTSVKTRYYPYPELGIAGSAFLIYHFAVYGTNPASLFYVLGGGFILSWTAYHSLHVSPCMTGHMLNNVGAYVNTSLRVTTSVVLKVVRSI